MLKESVPQESKGKHPVRGSQAGGRVAGWEGASRGQVMFCLSIWMLNTCHSHSGRIWQAAGLGAFFCLCYVHENLTELSYAVLQTMKHSW